MRDSVLLFQILFINFLQYLLVTCVDVNDESADLEESAEKIVLYIDLSRRSDAERDLVKEVRTVSFIEGMLDFAKSYGKGKGAGNDCMYIIAL